jgi:hypothetical protein
MPVSNSNIEFIIAENCPHCPRCLLKNSVGGDCYDPSDKDAGAQGEAARVPFDCAHAALNLVLYMKAKINVTGTLSLSRFSKRSYVENQLLTGDFYLSGNIPLMDSCYHPAYNTRKIPGQLELVSQVTPTTSTHAKATKAGSGASKVKESTAKIGRLESSMLPYRIMEPYFNALMRLLHLDETPAISLLSLFGLLEKSDTYRPMFSLDYSTLCLDSKYIAMNAKVVKLLKNNQEVENALYKVCFVTALFNMDRSSHRTHLKSKI